MSEQRQQLQTLVAEVAAAYFSNSPVAVGDISRVIAEIGSSLSSVGSETAPEPPQSIEAPIEASANAPEEASAATPKTKAEIRRSIGDNGLVSFEDGKTYKTLKRHLSTHGLTPNQYREKHGLPADYPMVSPSYSAQRSALAKSIGLGAKGRVARQVKPAAAPAPRRGGRKRAAPAT